MLLTVCTCHTRILHLSSFCVIQMLNNRETCTDLSDQTLTVTVNEDDTVLMIYDCTSIHVSACVAQR